MYFFIFQSGEQGPRGVHPSARLAQPREPSLSSVRDELRLKALAPRPTESIGIKYRIYRLLQTVTAVFLDTFKAHRAVLPSLLPRICAGCRCHAPAAAAARLISTKAPAYTCAHARPSAAGHILCTATAIVPAARLLLPPRPPDYDHRCMWVDLCYSRYSTYSRTSRYTSHSTNRRILDCRNAMRSRGV
jgi:hypothetical protein